MKLQNNNLNSLNLSGCSWYVRWVRAVWLGCLLCQIILIKPADAQELSVVEELLELDTQAALLAARRNVIGPLNTPGPAVTLASENLLLAIYGVGPSLTAEVLLGSEPYVFKNRRAQPISGRSIDYTLERIQPPCIYLKKEGRPEILCLGQVRP